MPTKREREYYAMGFRDGRKFEEMGYEATGRMSISRSELGPRAKPKRKLSAWQKFVKANSKKPRFKYKSGKKRGMLNLKALGVAYRKKKRR